MTLFCHLRYSLQKNTIQMCRHLLFILTFSSSLLVHFFYDFCHIFDSELHMPRALIKQSSYNFRARLAPMLRQLLKALDNISIQQSGNPLLIFCGLIWHVVEQNIAHRKGLSNLFYFFCIFLHFSSFRPTLHLLEYTYKPHEKDTHSPSLRRLRPHRSIKHH